MAPILKSRMKVGSKGISTTFVMCMASCAGSVIAEVIRNTIVHTWLACPNIIGVG